jgi:hypothetical protein
MHGHARLGQVALIASASTLAAMIVVPIAYLLRGH